MSRVAVLRAAEVTVLSCRDIVERETDFRERALTAWPRLQYRLHLAFCRACATWLRNGDLLIRAARRAPRPVVPTHAVPGTARPKEIP